VDKNYIQGGTKKSACHRNPREDRRYKAGRLGAPFEKCDAPVALAQETLDWLSREWKDKLDFVIWTGDNARLVTDMMTDTFGDLPIIPTLGNNDVYPHNVVVDRDSILEYYNHLWLRWIPSDQRQQFLRGGYFAADIPGLKLRVLSLNTMYFYKKNKAVKNCRKKGPARDHLEWFENQLQSARNTGMRVIVMGHVPPSPRDYRKTCFKGYLDLAAEYADVIVSHHYGHLNMDHYLLYDTTQSFKDHDEPVFSITRNIAKYVNWLHDLYSSLDVDQDVLEDPPPQYKSPLVAIQVSPSVIPKYYPSVRIYQYRVPEEDDKQGDGFELMNYNQYYANITHWEMEHFQEPLEYQLEYSTQDDYDLQDLSAPSLFKMAKYMVEGGNELWSAYTRNMFLRSQNDTIPGALDDVSY
ncbi:hypothetical protein K492DRAFT_134045, partial [Lichtheimia hyalospora FSU 10163]